MDHLAVSLRLAAHSILANHPGVAAGLRVSAGLFARLERPADDDHQPIGEGHCPTSNWAADSTGGSVGKSPAAGGAKIELIDGRPFDRLPDLDLTHRRSPPCWSQATT